MASSSWVLYRGSFSKGIREGFGKLTMEYGQSYEGQFADDMPHGYGYFITFQGETVKNILKINNILLVIDGKRGIDFKEFNSFFCFVVIRSKVFGRKESISIVSIAEDENI